jgi:hypothetical protein
MEELDNNSQEKDRRDSDRYSNDSRQEIFSETVRAGKRTYFFDVKSTRGGEYYLTITESKRRFGNDTGKFVYEKHKLFLYKEDFEKFADGLKSAVDFIQSGKVPEPVKKEQKVDNDPHVDVEFEDLGTETADMQASTDADEINSK